MSELRIIRKMAFSDKSIRFGFRDDESGLLHHHLICRDCGLVEEVKEDWLEELELQLSRDFGFMVLDHRLDLIGTYAACNENCKKAD